MGEINDDAESRVDARVGGETYAWIRDVVLIANVNVLDVDLKVVDHGLYQSLRERLRLRLAAGGLGLVLILLFCIDRSWHMIRNTHTRIHTHT